MGVDNGIERHGVRPDRAVELHPSGEQRTARVECARRADAGESGAGRLDDGIHGEG